MKENSMEMVLVANLPDLKGNKIRTNGNTTVSIAKLPKDIQELLKSFLANFNNIGELKQLLGNNITSGKEQEIDDAIRSTTLITKQLQKLTRNSYHISEQLLCDSHIALATCTDVGRMVFQTLLYRQPEELERYRALCLVTPPPVTLSRKIKHIIDKIKRIQESLSETTKKYDLTYTGNTTTAATTTSSATATTTNKINTHNLHTEDINGLLTDIENQYILVQRMISFLYTEINNLITIQSVKCKPSTPSLTLPLVVVRDDLADSLQDLNLGTPRTNILQKEHDLIVNTRLGGSLASPVQFSSYRTDKKPIVSSRKECISPRKVSYTAWDKLRNTVKDCKRPTYSLELYEQFIEGQDEEEGQQTERMLYKHNSIAYRHCSAKYRHLRGSHRKSPSYEQQVQLASSTAVERYHSSLRVSTRLSPFSLDTPQKTPIPRDTSPYTSTDTASASWRLCLNSPGDWRHVQPYLPTTTSTSTGTTGATTRASTTITTRIEEAEASPLIGVLQHIDQYVQRQPKTPPPPSLPVPPPIKINPTTSAPVVGEVKSLSAVDSHKAGGSASLLGTTSSGRSRQREGENEALPPRSRSGSSNSSSAGAEAQEVLSPGRPRGDSMALKRSPKSSHLAGTLSSSPGPLKLPGKKATIPAWMTESLSDTSATATTTSTTTTTAVVAENSIEEITQKLRAIYTANVPEKVGDVPKLLAKYAGKETELLEKVIKKYGPVPTTSSPSATTAKKSITPTPLGAGEKPEGLTGMSLFGKSTQPSTGFGAASSSLLGKPSEAPAATTSGSLFGKPSEAPAATTSGSIFGKPSEAPAATTPGSTSSLFGKPATPAVAGGSAPVGGGLFGSTSTDHATGTALGGLEGVQQRVQAIYTQHNPSKLAEIPALMEKYRGRELQLVANLEKKYGVAPVTSVSSATAGAGLFGGAAVGATPTPFGNAGAVTPTPTPFGGSSAIPSPFGGAASTTAGIPSPFGATTTCTAAGGNSLFGAGAAKPSGGLFGGQPSTGFGTGAAAATTGTGALFGSGAGTQGSAGVGGAVSPFANPTPTGGTGGLFGQASAAAPGVVSASSPFGNSGFSTPLGKTAAPATTSSLFQAQGGGLGGQQQPSTGFGGLNMGGGGSMGGAIGGTTSPGLFGTAKPPAAGMTGGFGGATSTGFGMPTNANSGAGSLFSPSASAPVASGSAGLNSIQAVQQRVQAIYAQYNPSKLAEIPSLMEKYRGRELQLVANLEKKYNIDHPTSTANSGAGGMFGSSPGAGSGAGTGVLFRSPNRGCFGASPEIGASTGFGAGAGGGSGPAASSLFGRPPTAGAGAAAGTGGLFGGLAAPSTQFGGTQQPQGSGGMGMSTGSGFGTTTVLGGGSSSSGFGSNVGSSFGGGGGLFGGGATNTNSMWGNR